jgi:hypothetical protein
METTDLNILKQYLSEEEIKQIVIDEYKSVIYNGIRAISPENRMKDYERVVSNAVHHYIETEADKLIGASVQNIIADKVKSVINKADYSFTVFRTKNAWDKEDSKAQTILNEAVAANKDLIYSKVAEQINALDITQIRALIIDSTVEYLTDKFKS